MSAIPELDPARVAHRERVPGARYWSMVLRRGFALRLVDVDGRANASLLAYNPVHTTERYNMADTLKGQETSRLTRGNMLFSDMGRVLLSIITDSLGWHDAIGGITGANDIRAQYGRARFQEHLNEFHRSGRELFLMELAKWGLTRRDLVPCVNFFHKVHADENGRLSHVEGHSSPGATVDLRAEMDTLVVLNTAPHPMETGSTWAPGPVDLAVHHVGPADGNDECVRFRPENHRAWINTQTHYCQEAMA